MLNLRYFRYFINFKCNDKVIIVYVKNALNMLLQMFDNIRALDLYVDHTNRPVAAKMISAEGEVWFFIKYKLYTRNIFTRISRI